LPINRTIHNDFVGDRGGLLGASGALRLEELAALFQATITDTPNGIACAVNSSKHLCDTSKPA
jgi:hypothetical protein